MKIAVTTDHSGKFVLASNIQRRISELGCKHTRLRTLTSMFGPDWPSVFTVKLASGLGNFTNEMVNVGSDIVEDSHGKPNLETRTCPTLIQALDELTQVGFNYHCSVRVVEIPTDIACEIILTHGHGESVIERTKTWSYDAFSDQVHFFDPATKKWAVVAVDGTLDYAPFEAKEAKDKT